MALERSRGDRYALSALRNRRALLAAEIVQLERQLRSRKDSLGHVDACLRLLDPDAEPERIPSRRLPQRIKLFRQGELGRLIVGVMREAGTWVSTQDIVGAILAAGGHGEAARPTVMPRVRGNLAYLHRQKKVVKTGTGTATRWSLSNY